MMETLLLRSFTPRFTPPNTTMLKYQSSDHYQVGAWAIALLNTFLGLADQALLNCNNKFGRMGI
ncbi:hypothetical protein [Nostoc sp.]|uniref:hypothetical protein n=1 Tax=Nostoc sp. TaxID=1180 RepID=UPI002FFAF5AC